MNLISEIILRNEQQQIVDTSIMNNYKGLFEPKNQQQSFKQQDKQRTSEVVSAVMSGFDPFDPKNYQQQEEQGIIDVQP